MLVLSRKENEKILFPTLGVSVEVLRIQGNKTRLGIDAPTEVPVLRHEVAGLKGIEFAADGESANSKLSRLMRAMRERLDSQAVALNLLHEHLEADSAAQNLVLDAFKELRLLDREANEIVEDSPAQNASIPHALLVEDDPNQRELLASYLRLSGFEVNTSCDGQDALEYLSLHARPDVVLVDMKMPRCDGPSFISTVRSNQELDGMKLVAVSATEPASLGIPAGPTGIDRWFPKPLDVERLVSELAKEFGAGTVAA